MQYTVIINGISYDIPCYSISISEDLEKIELLNNGNQKFREKCKNMYDFICKILGKENSLEILGKFENSDPNTINITYLEIVKSYNKPLSDYNLENSEQKLSSDLVDKILELAKIVPLNEGIKNKKYW